MLVITRRFGQSFRIGNDIVIRVISSSQYGIVIGIDAPKSIPIQRIDKEITSS